MKAISSESLDKRIDDILEQMSQVDPESDEYETLLARLTKLCAIRDNSDKIEREAENKKAELSEAEKARRVQTCLAVAKGLGLSAAFIIGLNFEKSGNLCSGVFRNLWSTFKPSSK